MSCLPCIQAAAAAQSGQSRPASYRSLSTPNPDCKYSEEQMIQWRNLCKCVRDNALYSQLSLTIVDMNKAIGVISSAINHSINICYFEKLLDALEPTILKIIDSGLCA
jgi:hypothetical protein